MTNSANYKMDWNLMAVTVFAQGINYLIVLTEGYQIGMSELMG